MRKKKRRFTLVYSGNEKDYLKCTGFLLKSCILHINAKLWPCQGCTIVETLETCFKPLLNLGSHIWLAGPKAK